MTKEQIVKGSRLLEDIKYLQKELDSLNSNKESEDLFIEISVPRRGGVGNHPLHLIRDKSLVMYIKDTAITRLRDEIKRIETQIENL